MSIEDERIFLYRAEVESEVRHMISLLPPFDVQRQGLPGASVAGFLAEPPEAGGKLLGDNFTPNEMFVDFLHAVIAEWAPKNPDFLEAARAQGEGMVVVIDGRTPDPGGELMPEDLFGWFTVKAGEVLRDSYEPNPRHALLSDHGFFRLEPFLHEKLLDTLRRIRPEGDG
jgi:hypothetical protein